MASGEANSNLYLLVAKRCKAKHEYLQSFDLGETFVVCKPDMLAR